MIAIYARQSVERENSVSIETQIDFCKAMLKPNERNEAWRNRQKCRVPSIQWI